MCAQIFFAPDEVPLKARVRVCPPGSNEPDPKVPVVTPLLGGVPHRVKFYILENGEFAILGEPSTLKSGVRFVPETTYTAADAPAGLKLMVFEGGKRNHYARYPRCVVIVTRLADGRYMSVHGQAYDHWLRLFELPESAQLVPIGDCKHMVTTDDTVELPIKPGSEVWKVLYAAGARFIDAYRSEGSRHSYHTLLPDGWELRPTDREFIRGGREAEIIDEKGTVRANAIWFPWQGREEGNVSLVENV